MKGSQTLIRDTDDSTLYDCTALLTAVSNFFVYLCFNPLEIAAPHTGHLIAFRAVTIPYFSFIDRQVTMAAANFLAVLGEQDECLVFATGHRSISKLLLMIKQMVSIFNPPYLPDWLGWAFRPLFLRVQF